MNKETLTFKEALNNKLVELDKIYAQLREYHADPVHTNRESSYMKESLRDFGCKSMEIFKIKQAWEL